MNIVKQSESTAARRTIAVEVRDDSNLPVTGLTLTAAWRFVKGDGTSATAAGTLTELSAANSPGVYTYLATTGEVDTLGNCKLAYSSTTNAYIAIGGYIQVVPFNPYDAAALGMTNLDTTVSSRGTSTLTQSQITGGAYAINSASFAFNAALDFTTTQKSATIARVTLVDTLTTYTGNTVQTGDSFARLGAPVGASISADIAAIPTTSAPTTAQISAQLLTDYGAGPWTSDGNVVSFTAGSITDAAFTIPSETGVPSGVIGMIVALGHRLLNIRRVKKTATGSGTGTIATYLSNGTSVRYSSTYTTTASADSTDDIAAGS